jgi:hypothetical protein
LDRLINVGFSNSFISAMGLFSVTKGLIRSRPKLLQCSPEL